MMVMLFLGMPRGSSLSNGAMPVRKSLDIVNLLLEATSVVEDKILLYPTVWFLQAILYCSDYRTLAATVLMNDLSRAPSSYRFTSVFVLASPLNRPWSSLTCLHLS